ncbi:MAG: hypothetical protein JST06_09040 [Bacteroidetes bacterium]|nr:hypothetical protein [Bacteroidota bacterium]MBS1629328.1 hypothetical protein [Bacteroidota bacterium]
MKTHTDGAVPFTSTLLTASILLAQIDMHGLFDYALKAGIGGAIWLGYKVVADRIDRYRKKREATSK